MSSVKIIVAKITCLVVLAITGFGCMGTKVHFEDTPANVDLTQGRSIEGKSSGFQLFLFIPIGVNDRHETAYRRLKQAAGNNYITDIKIKESWTWAYVGTVYHTTLSATAYQKKDKPVNDTTRTLADNLSKLKTLHENGVLSNAEYEAARKKALDDL